MLQIRQAATALKAANEGVKHCGVQHIYQSKEDAMTSKQGMYYDFSPEQDGQIGEDAM